MERDVSNLDQNVLQTRSQNNTPPMRMKEQFEPQKDIFIRHRHLIEWVQKNGGYLHPTAQIAFTSRKGFHALVMEGERLEAGSRVVGCPMPLTISVLNALDITPFSSNGSRFPKEFLHSQISQPESLQAFFLMEQLVLGNKSWWNPYIAALPTVQEIADSQFQSEEDLRWLDGTNLRTALDTHVGKWRAMYVTGMAQLKALGWSRISEGSYTWERFQWAATMYCSRSFTSQVLEDTLPADQARMQHHQRDDKIQRGGRVDLAKLFGDHFGVLLPLMDLLNHRSAAKVEWQARYSFVGLQVLEDYDSGQEICNNYGPRENEGLLLTYGFTIPDNPYDHVVIALKAPPGSPLAKARTWQKDLRSDLEFRCFLFDYRHPQATGAIALETSIFSFDLLDSISIYCANEHEMELMETRRQSLFSYCLGPSPLFEDGRIILATLSQILLDCTARASKLRSTDPRASDPPLEAANQKQKHAKAYRDGQLEIVETSVAVSTYILKTAVQEGRQDKILDNLQHIFPEKVFRNLDTLVSRYSKRLTRPSELLTPSALLDMLPANLAMSITNCLAQVQSNLTELRGSTLPRTSCDKSKFAVIISAMYGEYSSGIKLPHRVSSRIAMLSERYPLDPESWAYVPDPEDDAPADLMDLLQTRAGMSPQMSADSSIRQWLRPERICWGWNVMEEEAVRVPSSVLDSREDISGKLDPLTTLIYWEQC